jgi:Rrf2 family nitric oxide-sensitive transcriptional repressor
MRLTAYTDYALRTLMYLAANRDRLVTIQDVADAHAIAKNHLTKVVHQLGQLGVIETIRGRSGGLRLRHEPEDINIGDIVRNTESDFYMASCFDASSEDCVYSASCALKSTLGRATNAFLGVLDEVTLDKLVPREPRRAAAKVALSKTAPKAKPAAPKAARVQFTATRRKA